MNISLFRSIAHQYQNLRAVNTVPMMNTISHLIENQVIRHHLPVNFYAGFQFFSRFPAQKELYTRLGAAARRVYVFGVPDVQPPRISGIEYIAIPRDSPLAQEWFLLIDTPSFWTALLTCEMSGTDDITSGRRYDGVWTFDREIVDRASLLMTQAMGEAYMPVTERNHQQQTMHIAEITSHLVERMEGKRLETQRQIVRLAALHRLAGALLREQELLGLLQQAAQILHTVLGATDVAIALRDKDERYVISAGTGNISTESYVTLNKNCPSGRAITSGSPVHVKDMRQTRERDILLPAALTVFAAPIIGRRVYGVVTIGGVDPALWDVEDGRTLMSFASILASAIEQYVNSNRDSSASTDYVRRMEQAVISLRAPLNRIQELQHQLRDTDSITTVQESLLDQLDNVTSSLIEAVGPGEQSTSRLIKPRGHYEELDTF